jgi:hypothetical protein
MIDEKELYVRALRETLVWALQATVKTGFEGWEELRRKIGSDLSEQVLDKVETNLHSSKSILIPEPAALDFDVLAYGGIRLLKVSKKSSEAVSTLVDG